MTDASNPIEAVRARLDGGRKWMKRSFGDFTEPDTNVCLGGACMSVGLEDYTLIEGVITEQFPDRQSRTAFYPSIPRFNDDARTTWADVDLVLDKASVRWDEAVR